MNRIPDLETVGRIIERVSDEVVLARFRKLDTADIESKATAGDPLDVVTVADREAEARLTRELQVVAPWAAVVGEEATQARPELLLRLDRNDPVWLIDPIDGTKNFAHGDDRFGTMVSYVAAGETRAAWIHLPVRRQLFAAASGEGAWVNGRRLACAPIASPARFRGNLHTRYMGPATSDAVRRALHPHVDFVPSSGCAAIEYTNVIEGVTDFSFYYRLLPWDHAAPALILGEAGGIVQHGSGHRYGPRSPNQLTVLARTEAVTRQVRQWLLDGGAGAGPA